MMKQNRSFVRNIFIVSRQTRGARVSHDPKTGDVFKTPIEVESAGEQNVCLAVLNHTLEQILSKSELKDKPIQIFTLDNLAIKVREIQNKMEKGLSGEEITLSVVREWMSDDNKLEIDRLVGLIEVLPQIQLRKISDLKNVSSANAVYDQYFKMLQMAWAMVPPPALKEIEDVAAF